MKLALLLVLAAAPAFSQQADGGTPQESDEQLKKELEGALSPPTATSPSPSPTTSATTSSPRGSQSLNPDVSAIIDADFGYLRRPLSFLNGDDPDLHANAGTHALGFTAQEVEVAFSAIVDPYFKGELYLTIPNLDGLEVEEGVVTTTSLPGNLQVRAGSFRSAFGRQNGQHLHVQDFTRRPLINAAFLGADGLRGPGMQVSWLAPLPFYLTLYGEAFSIRANDVQPIGTGAGPFAPVASFGSDASRRPTLAGEAKAFFPFGDAWSLYVGGNVATGKSPGLYELRDNGDVASVGKDRETVLVGGDAYLKWKPPNVSGGYTSLTLQTEAIFRHFTAADGLQDEWDGGAYAQLVAQVARRWFLGVRADFVGIPSSSVLGRTLRYSASVTWQASEFARLRAYGEFERASASIGDEALPPGHLIPLALPADAVSAFLQLEISIGAHGAHAF